MVIVGLWFWATYNRLVTANEAISKQWAQVQVQYQRRFDLIPNLVESVKGIMAQEQTVFNNLAEARAHYSGATALNDQVAAANEVETTLGRLLAIVENYPELKSAENVQTLMAQLEGTENRISVERSRYNEAVRSFNVMIKRFPTQIIAGRFRFSEKTYFEATPAAAETVPSVNLQVNQ